MSITNSTSVSINGIYKFIGDKTFTDNIILSGNLFSQGNINISGSFVSSGTITSTGNISSGGTITSTGNISTSGNILLSGDATFLQQFTTSTWGGNPWVSVGKIEYHSNRWYMVSGADSSEVTRWRRSDVDLMWLDNGGNLGLVGDITTFASDIRLKTNIVKIESPIQKIKKLSGVHFEWDTNNNKLKFIKKRNDTGLIAQEVLEVLPDAVKPAPFDLDMDKNSISGENYLTIQYEKLVPLLVEAIKEQQEQIEMQEISIKNLISRLEKLENIEE